MNKIFKTISSTVVIFALVVTAFSAPLVSVAHAQTNSGFSFDFPSFDMPSFDFGSDSSSATAGSGSFTIQTCDINATNIQVPTGGNTTLTWSTSGFDVFTLNGQSLNLADGSLQMTNILQNTTYELIAATSDGTGNCVARVTVTCLPPPPGECRLEVTKVVDKTAANVGDTLTYTMTVKNTGTADCTGGGVKIEDVLSDKLSYLTQNVSSNLTAGYGGYGVYTAGDRTLRFNGNTLNPGEQGTMTVTARVNTPASCGDFEIPNQAKATAYELNNFGTWAYSQTVRTAVNNDCTVNPAPSCDSFTANPSSIVVGGSSVLSWQTSHATAVSMNNGIGNVVADGSVTVSPTTNTTYTLTVYGTENRSVNCSVPVTVSVNDPAPSCDVFTASPNTIAVGGSSVLAWQTSNATVVAINNGIGNVAADGSLSVSPLATTVYRLTVFGTQNRSVNCEVPVTVSEDPAPVCEYFTATPNALAAGGGSVNLSWKVLRATNVSISPTVGSVATQGTYATNVTASTNFVLTATDADGDQVTCPAPVTVAAQEIFTCQDNVSFTASDYSISRGDDTVLSWNVTNADSVSISSLGTVVSGGSKSVEPSSDTTYTLTAVKGSKSINCPLSVTVSSGGGGGGGSPTPRCELTISDNKIRAGEQITLKWNTSNATEVIIEDNKNKTIMSTEKYLSKDKKDHYDGSIKLKPTRDTEYTLVASRGSKDRTCKVKVDVDDLTVITDRDQKPLVAGISLSNVPYTGFEAGPMLTILFYMLLIAWALFVTYLIVIRPKVAVGVAGGKFIDMSTPSVYSMQQAEAVRPDVFQNVVMSTVATAAAPTNLPTGTPVIGYENVVEAHNPHHVNDEAITALENRAHTQHALLSSDAIRHFISTTAGSVERNEALDQVIAEAKGMYPLEDGWIVINEARMQSLCATCMVNAVASVTAPFVPAIVPDGSSSLAEAIVTGNIVAAYEMIGGRPMFALADAAADLDAVVRARRGEVVSISELLKSETSALSDEKLKNMISALTGAIDGTYTDEASAVKMAIMKAVKEVA